MLTWFRWVSLVLAVSALLAWAVVSGLDHIPEDPSSASRARPGEPRRMADPTVYIFVAPTRHEALRGAEIILRIAAALLVAVHLVILNMDRARR